MMGASLFYTPLRILSKKDNLKRIILKRKSTRHAENKVEEAPYKLWYIGHSQSQPNVKCGRKLTLMTERRRSRMSRGTVSNTSVIVQ